MSEIGLGHALRLSSNLIMTRLLLPEAFGLMAMVTSLQIGLQLFSDMGIKKSIVRSERGEEDHFLRVAWVVQVMRGAALAVILLLIGGLLWLWAPHYAPQGTVYADPDLPGLIALSSLVLLMQGAQSTCQYLAIRRLQMLPVTILQVGGQAIGLVAMILLAQIHASVWTLLIGSLIGSASRLILSHLIFKGPRMALAWDKEISGELWQFGKWLILSSAFTFLASHADRLIIGALLDATLFGFYAIAVVWVRMAISLTTKLADTIGFSIFSEVQRKDPEQVKSVYRKFSLIIDAICLISFCIIFFGAGLIVDLLYTDTYSDVKNLIPLLAFGILGARFGPLGMLTLSRGDSKTMMWVSALRAAVICIAIPVAFRLVGINGALLAVALSPLAGVTIFMARAAPVLGRQLWVEGAWLIGILIAAAIAAGGAF